MPKRTPKNCSLIKEALKLGIGYPFGITDHICDGYAKGENDDEPREECKRCKYFDGEREDDE